MPVALVLLVVTIITIVVNCWWIGCCISLSTTWGRGCARTGTITILLDLFVLPLALHFHGDSQSLSQLRIVLQVHTYRALATCGDISDHAAGAIGRGALSSTELVTHEDWRCEQDIGQLANA